MTEEQQQSQTGADQPQASETPKQQSGKTPIESLPPDIQAYIDELRREAQGYRNAKKAAEQVAKEAEEKRLAEQQEWQKLAESRAAELEKLKPVAEQFDEIQEAFKAGLDARLKNIPDDVLKGMVEPVRAALSPIKFSQWLDANMKRLTARKAPPLDAGAQGEGTNGKKRLSFRDLKRASY